MSTGGSIGMIQHIPILQVAVPMIAAPLCALIGRRDLAWLLTFLVTIAAFLMSLHLLDRALTEGPFIYEIGGWPPPWGIAYAIDPINATVLLVLSMIAVVVLPFARKSVDAEIEERSQPLFYTAFLLCLTGLLGVVATGDAFNIFVFLEISSLSTYVLVAMGAKRSRKALAAAYNYLIMGTVGATFYVTGIGLLYMVTGTLNLADLAERIPPLGESRVLEAAYAFIVVGIGLKLAMVPVHTWLPAAYAQAPSIVGAFLAATATKTAVYVLVRFSFDVFGPGYDFGQFILDKVVLPLALVGMVAGSVIACYQTDLRRILAYSSVAQVGYMVLGITLISTAGLAAGILHLFNHALMKGALFLALGCITLNTGLLRGGAVTVEGIAGLGRRMPFTMGAIVLGGLSLIGVPLTVGFISKWLLIEASVADGRWWLVAIIVGSSLIAVIYIWRIVEAAYLRPADPDVEVREAPLSMLIPVWVLVVANFWFGIDATTTVDIARQAAAVIMGDAP